MALAGQLLANGGSMKAMHRLLMSSEAYQQAALRDPAKERADPANALFVRRAPVRLEGEAIRDSLLAVSGLLDNKMYGPGIADEKTPRRSISLRVRRSKLTGSMVSFDQPEPLASRGLRPSTTFAPQALILMNGSLARSAAAAFAERITKSAGHGSPLFPRTGKPEASRTASNRLRELVKELYRHFFKCSVWPTQPPKG